MEVGAAFDRRHGLTKPERRRTIWRRIGPRASTAPVMAAPSIDRPSFEPPQTRQ